MLERLGAGGMATLFLGQREGANDFAKPVAIKVVHPHLVERDERFVTMFHDEARVASLIDHPNVMPVEDFGVVRGAHFLVMPYVHGCSLSDLLKTLSREGRGVSEVVAVAIALQIADGLHAAHEAVDERGAPLRIVHRDVSPQNVLVAHNGLVRVIDFGIAKATGRMWETNVASVKGKLRYMAPEQAGKLSVDRRTDVYALGIVLFEMLTMRPYLDPETGPELIKQVIAPPRRDPREHVETISPAVADAVMRALSPQPADRYTSARELRLALAKAAPDAAAMDATSLATLVRATMGKQLARRQEIVASASRSLSLSLPAETGTAENEWSDAPSSEAALGTLTADVPGATFTADEPSEWTVFRHSTPATALEPVAPPSPPSSKRAWAVAVGLLVLISIVGIVWWTGKDTVAVVPVTPAVSATAPVVATEGGDEEPARTETPSGTQARGETQPPTMDLPERPARARQATPRARMRARASKRRSSMMSATRDRMAGAGGDPWLPLATMFESN